MSDCYICGNPSQGKEEHGHALCDSKKCRSSIRICYLLEDTQWWLEHERRRFHKSRGNWTRYIAQGGKRLIDYTPQP